MKRFVALLLLIPISAVAAEVEDCSRIENQSERLACFDRRFPNSDRGDLKPVQTESERTTEKTESATTTESASASEPVAATPQAAPAPAREEPAEVSQGVMFGKDPVINLTATIKALRRSDTQNMVFLFDNDQIWMQITPRVLPYHEGDKVTIENGFMGGYFMESSSGVITRVKRIQ